MLQVTYWAHVSGPSPSYSALNQNGSCGMQGTLSGWVDANCNFRLFGGYGYTANGTEGDLNDLWMYMR
jgi:hypothetical protein